MVLRFVGGDATATGQWLGSEEEPRSVLHPAAMDGQLRIRAYAESDRATVRRLCCETGFLGKPIDPIFQDRTLFADLFTRPYLDHEPEWALVAEMDGSLVGYLLGSVRRDFAWVLMRCGAFTALRMSLRAVSGCYAQHPRSARFVRWLLTSGLWEQPKHPPRAAHLHLDIHRSFRGRGIGRRLWDTYEQRLKAAGVTQCYGAFFSHPERRPETAYARYGFSVFDRKRTTLFEPEVPDPVEVVCVQKKL